MHLTSKLEPSQETIFSWTIVPFRSSSPSCCLVISLGAKIQASFLTSTMSSDKKEDESWKEWGCKTHRLENSLPQPSSPNVFQNGCLIDLGRDDKMPHRPSNGPWTKWPFDNQSHSLINDHYESDSIELLHPKTSPF